MKKTRGQKSRVRVPLKGPVSQLEFFINSFDFAELVWENVCKMYRSSYGDSITEEAASLVILKSQKCLSYFYN
jgi:hypothetical protein